jgi:hemerythrin-like metal-binding protein
MALPTWKDGFSASDPALDRHHKKLVDLINQLHDAMKEGRGRFAFGDVLSQLAGYAKTHFADEEKRMLACKYGGYAAHKHVHGTSAGHGAEMLRKVDSGSLSVNGEALKA